MTAPPVDVRLVRFPLGLVRDLAHGDADRPADWHEQYETAGIVAISRMLLGAYAAMDVPVDDTSPWWVFGVVVDGRVVGDAGFHGPPAGSRPVEVEIGYQVVPAFRRRGVATRACALLLAHSWCHGAEVVRADVEPDNPFRAGSLAVLHANGFTPTERGDLAVAAPAGGAA